jgi:hypothetical protein
MSPQREMNSNQVRHVKDVAEEVASKCITELKQAEMFMKMNGTPVESVLIANLASQNSLIQPNQS